MDNEHRERFRLTIDPTFYERLDAYMMEYLNLAFGILRIHWSRNPDVDVLGSQMFAFQDHMEQHFHDFMSRVMDEYNVEIVQITKWQMKKEQPDAGEQPS